MQSRIDETIKRHDTGYNCAQSVACTYCDLVGIDEETAFKVSEGLGAGMGNMEGTCGAISGVCLLAGLKNSTANLEKPNSKADTYKLSREIMSDFKTKTGSVTCKELKGVETGKMLCSCPDCIKIAAEIAENVLFE